MTHEGLGAAIPAERLGVPQALSEEILNAPGVLRGIAIDIGRRHQRREGDYYLTPGVAIEDDELAINALVRVGYLHYESDQTIYAVVDEQVKPWYRLGPGKVERGDGEVVDTLEERKRIGKILLLAGTALDKAVIEDLQSFDADTLFDGGLSEQIMTVEQQIAALQTRLAELYAQHEAGAEQQTEPRKTRVTIRSGWQHDGEQSPVTEYDAETSLQEALDLAAQNFRAVNHRSDVQGTPQIEIQQGETTVTVPSEVWRRYFQMISGPLGFWERTAVEHARNQAERAQ